MIDVYTLIPPMVEDIITLEPHFHENMPEFPLGILTPIDSGAGVVLRGRERITPVAFQIDIYDTALQRCEERAAKIAERLTMRGFLRGQGQSVKENGLRRRTLSFTAKIDEVNGIIYRR